MSLCGHPLLAADTNVPNQNLVGQAEAAFAEGVRLRNESAKARPYFLKTAELLEELRQRGVSNTLLYRNLGNAYLLAGDLPHAILSFRQGLRLATGDSHLLRCLNDARERVVYPEWSSLGRQPPDRRPPWLPRLRPVWIFAGAVLLYLTAWAAVPRWLMIRRAVLLVLGLGGFVLTAGLGLLLLDAERQEQVEKERPLVVIADDGILLRKGNSRDFPPRWETVVNKGVEARLLFERDDWLQIQLAAGEIGWIERGLALIDRP